MAQEESGNHEASAFAGDPPTSSQKPRTWSQRWGDALCINWTLGLVLWVLLHATLLVDSTAFARVAALFDRPALAWLEAVGGFAAIVGVSIHLQQQQAFASRVKSMLGLSVLSLASYGYHLFLLRWPWLTGAAAYDSRIAWWSAVLSTTSHGVPWRAFGELLGIAILLTHGFLGLSGTAAWQRFGGAPQRHHFVLVAVGLLTYLSASSVVIALATGRR